MGRWTWWLILKLLLIVRVAAAAEGSPPCQAEVYASDGGKWSVGGTGRVFCSCNNSDSDAGSRLNLRLSGKRLLQEIINGTIAQHTQPNPTETVQSEYECWWDEAPLASVKVTVFAVLNVTDLTCRFHGKYKLSCSFSRAEGKDFWAGTRYQLYVRSGETANCTAGKDDPARMHCLLTTRGYANQLETQSFTLTMISDRGGAGPPQEIQMLTAHMYAPEWPPDRRAKVTDKDKQTCLAWDNEQQLVNEQLEWVVELRPRRLEIPSLNLTLPGGEKTDQGILTFCFPHPPQGFQTFDVRLKRRFDKPNAIWSEYYPEFPITTTATVPARPPRFLPNGFSYKKDKQALTVFWFQLEEMEHNGPNLTYEALWDGTKKADHTNSNSATFTNWNVDRSANVTVRSRNSLGLSVDSSWLPVPAISEVAKRQSATLKYYSERFTLAWDRPEENSNLRGYTIYWCNASDTLGQFCKEGALISTASLDDGERLEHRFDSTMALMDMAVAPNYSDHASGGMILRLVADENYKEVASSTFKKVFMQTIGILLMLGLIAMAARKLRDMHNIKVELPPMGTERPKPTPPLESPPVWGVPHIYSTNYSTDDGIELSTFRSNGGGTVSQAEEQHAVVEEFETELAAEPEPESLSHLPILSRNPDGSDGNDRPPPPVLNSNGYVVPSPPPLVPNNGGYVAAPSPRIIPNNEFINPTPPRLIPNHDGYIVSQPPRTIPNSNGYVEMTPPVIPSNVGYINPTPPRLIPNNDGYIMPPPPRINPSSNGYVSPPEPR